MKKYLFIVVLGAVLFVGCKSEQEKALDAAIATKDLATLRSFAGTNSDAMEDRVKKKYDAAVETLVKDSTLYDAVINVGNAIASCNAAHEYLKTLPKGIHADEVKVVLKEKELLAESLKEGFRKISKEFSLYEYTSSVPRKRGETYQSDRMTFSFSEIDENGCGTISGKSTGLRTFDLLVKDKKGERISDGNEFGDYNIAYYFLTYFVLSGNYYVDDDLMIHASINADRVVDNTPVKTESFFRTPLQDTEVRREKVKKAIEVNEKNDKRHRFYQMVFTWKEGEMDYFSTKIKGYGDYWLEASLK